MAPPQNRSRLQEEEIEAHRLLTQSINMLSDRIQRTESDFVGHLKKVEERLDQIVDLTKTVAVLQSQTTQQGDSITDMRASQREHFQKMDGSITRIHTRIEEVQEHNRNKIELINAQVDGRIKEIDLAVEKQIKEVSKQAGETEKELKAWLNRGWGAWAIFVFIVGIGSAGFYKWVDSLEKEKEATLKTLSTVVQQVDKTTNLAQKTDEEFKEMKLTVKQVQLSLSDIDKQLDVLRNKR